MTRYDFKLAWNDMKWANVCWLNINVQNECCFAEWYCSGMRTQC